MEVPRDAEEKRVLFASLDSFWCVLSFNTMKLSLSKDMLRDSLIVLVFSERFSLEDEFQTFLKPITSL